MHLLQNIWTGSDVKQVKWGEKEGKGQRWSLVTARKQMASWKRRLAVLINQFTTGCLTIVGLQSARPFVLVASTNQTANREERRKEENKKREYERFPRRRAKREGGRLGNGQLASLSCKFMASSSSPNQVKRPTVEWSFGRGRSWSACRLAILYSLG